MKSLITILFTCVYIILIQNLNAQNDVIWERSDTSKIQPYFNNIPGCIVLYDLNNDSYFYRDIMKCQKQFTPLSTFKIVNTVIGIETGAINNQNSVIKWDKERDPEQDFWAKLNWNKDHTLESAFDNSVVWFYQELARRIGEYDLNKYVELFSYGNQMITGKIDEFWLNGSLKISAKQQVDFLKKFYTNEFDLTDKTMYISKKIFLQEQTDDYKFSYKTGGGDIKNTLFIGWMVGYVETDNNVYFFALNVTAPEYDTVHKYRKDITWNILREFNLID